VKFFLNFYQSPTIGALLANREYAPVPSIVISQFGIWMKCRGQPALPAQATTVRTMSVPQEIAFLSNLFSSIFDDPTSNVQWALDINEDEVNLERLLNSEVEIALVNPFNTISDTYQSLLNDPDFLVFPAFTFAWTWTYNPILATGITIADKQLVLDPETVFLIYYSCIITWDHPKILALNPWLADVFGLLTNVPMQQVIPCSIIASKVPGANYLIDQSTKFSNRFPFGDVSYCVGNYSQELWDAYYSCKSLPAYNLQYTENEIVSSSLVMGTIGGSGYMVSKTFRNIQTIYFPNSNNSILVTQHLFTD